MLFAAFYKGNNFCYSHCLLPLTVKLQKGCSLQKLTLIEKGDKNDNGRVTSPESVQLDLKTGRAQNKTGY